jgi:hypothetical protein
MTVLTLVKDQIGARGQGKDQEGEGRGTSTHHGCMLIDSPVGLQAAAKAKKEV